MDIAEGFPAKPPATAIPGNSYWKGRLRTVDLLALIRLDQLLLLMQTLFAFFTKQATLCLMTHSLTTHSIPTHSITMLDTNSQDYITLCSVDRLIVLAPCVVKNALNDGKKFVKLTTGCVCIYKTLQCLLLLKFTA